MKKIFKRAIMAITALAVMLTAVVFDVPGKITAEAAVSASAAGGCGGSHDGWTEWTSTNSLPTTSGRYYLANNVTTIKEGNSSAAAMLENGVNIVLCLNGKTIKTSTKELKFFYIGSGGALTLCDCQGGGELTGGYNTNYGGAIYVVSGGTFTMYGGKISNNTSGSGCGVYVNGNGTSFTMYGGDISNNRALSDSGKGSGVYVGSGSTFIMNGGTISGNIAGKPDNWVPGNGGGVYVAGNFTINGKVDITGNKLSNFTVNDVCLADGKTITIGSDFDTDSPISVDTTPEPTCESPVDVTTFAGDVTAKDISGKFNASLSGQSIVYNDGKVQLTAAHNFSNSTTIAPTCTEPGGETGTCDVCGEETFNPTTPATGHDYGAWSITTDPTESAEGTAERVCNNDGTHKETKTDVPALNDTSVWTKTSQDDKDVYTSEYGTVEVAKTGGNVDSGNSGNTGNSGNSGNSGNTGNSGDTGNTNNSDDNSTPVNATNEVRQDENVPKTELATPTEELISAVLTPEEQAQLKDGDEVKFVLQVGDTVSDEDKQLAESSLEADEGLKIAQYMDISLIKEINGNRTKVTKTNEPIKLTFEVPEALRGSARTFEVLRVCDGEATLLSDLDDDENTVTIETDILTTYVLVYRESSSAPESGNPATGIAVSLVPIAAALAFVTAAVIRKKK